MAIHDGLILDLENKRGEELMLEDLGLFLYDLATLYDLIRLALDPAYRDYRFGKYPLFRGRRPLKPQDQLIVEQILLKGDVRVAVSLKQSSSSAVIALELFTLEIASLFDLPSRKVKRSGSHEATDKARARLATRGAEQHLQTVRRRLTRSSLTVRGIKLHASQD